MIPWWTVRDRLYSLACAVDALYYRARRATLGRAACWWRGEHVEVFTAGTLEPLASLGGGPLPPAEEWEGTYCFRCGESLGGRPFGGAP